MDGMENAQAGNSWSWRSIRHNRGSAPAERSTVFECVEEMWMRIWENSVQQFMQRSKYTGAKVTVGQDR